MSKTKTKTKQKFVLEIFTPGIHTIPAEIAGKIIDNEKLQPRVETTLNKEFLDSLKQSNGNWDPVLVRPFKVDNSLQTIDGRRRVKGCLELGLPITVMVQEMEEKEAWTKALSSFNREDLDLLSEMLAYKRSAEEFAMSDQDIARERGENRTRVSVLRRASQLFHVERSEIQNFLEAGVGYSDIRATIILDDWSLIKSFFEMKIRLQLNNMVFEKLVKLQKDFEWFVENVNRKFGHVKYSNRDYDNASVVIKNIPELVDEIYPVDADWGFLYEDVREVFKHRIFSIFNKKKIDYFNLIRIGNYRDKFEVESIRKYYGIVMSAWEIHGDSIPLRLELWEQVLNYRNVEPYQSKTRNKLDKLLEEVWRVKTSNELNKIKQVMVKYENVIDNSKARIRPTPKNQEVQEVEEVQDKTFIDLGEKKEAPTNIIPDPDLIRCAICGDMGKKVSTCNFCDDEFCGNCVSEKLTYQLNKHKNELSKFNEPEQIDDQLSVVISERQKVLSKLRKLEKDIQEDIDTGYDSLKPIMVQLKDFLQYGNLGKMILSDIEAGLKTFTTAYADRMSKVETDVSPIDQSVTEASTDQSNEPIDKMDHSIDQKPSLLDESVIDCDVVEGGLRCEYIKNHDDDHLFSIMEEDLNSVSIDDRIERIELKYEIDDVHYIDDSDFQKNDIDKILLHYAEGMKIDVLVALENFEKQQYTEDILEYCQSVFEYRKKVPGILKNPKNMTARILRLHRIAELYISTELNYREWSWHLDLPRSLWLMVIIEPQVTENKIRIIPRIIPFYDKRIRSIEVGSIDRSIDEGGN